MNVKNKKKVVAVFFTAAMPLVVLCLFTPTPVLARTVIFLTSGTSWTVPTNWGNFYNTIETIGGGGNGGSGAAAVGGGGGGYSKKFNINLTPGDTVTYAVGAAAGDTYFCNSTSNCTAITDSAVVVGAKGGGNGIDTTTRGVGGASASGVGDIKFSGGLGGNDSSATGDAAAGAGGGAGGPQGTGGAGGSAGGTSNCCAGGGGGAGGGAAGATGSGAAQGAVGGDNYLGAGGGLTSGAAGSNGGGGGGGFTTTIPGGSGGAGTEWSALYGSGGGGGGGTGTQNGGGGGLYGGAGGGGLVGGGGAQGVIVITYDEVPVRTMRLFRSIKLYNGKLVIYPTRTSTTATTEGTLSFVNSAESVAATITIPASAQAGDVAILFDSARSGSLPANVAPSGWSLATAFVGSVTRLNVWYKIIAAGEPNSVVTGMDGSTADNKVMQVFRGSSPITAVSPIDWDSELSSSDPAAQTVNASSQAAPLVVIGMAVSEPGTGAFTTESPAFDASVANSSGDMLVGYKIYNSSPADHSLDVADLTTVDGLASGLLKVAF